jgi:lipoyl(octanoyl) transferase
MLDDALRSAGSPLPDALPAPVFGRTDDATVHWAVSEGHIRYPEAVAAMEARVAAINAGVAPELIWLLEHPPLYTAGVSAKAEDLLQPAQFPVYPTEPCAPLFRRWSTG